MTSAQQLVAAQERVIAMASNLADAFPEACDWKELPIEEVVAAVRALRALSVPPESR